MLKGSTRLLKADPAYNCQVVKPVPIPSSQKFSDEMKIILQANVGSMAEDMFYRCNKILFSTIAYYSQDCSRVTRRNSYTVLLKPLPDGSDVGHIKHFVVHKETGKVFACCTTYKTTGAIMDNVATHVQAMEQTG